MRVGCEALSSLLKALASHHDPKVKSSTASCAASKKQKAERLANAELIFAFAQLRGEGTQIDPHGLRRKPKIPKIINLDNCVKLH